jgi:uncharacterized Fe-S cluster protein YjdI/CDGSH-type Zn-finger protein
MSRPSGESEKRAHEGGTGAPPVPGARNVAPDLTRRYETEGIVVEWYAGRCIHSANCIRSLPSVFDPRRRPWVDPDAAGADEIASAVLRCPTGALHFVRTDDGPQESPDEPTTLSPIRDGPLYVRGDVVVRGYGGEAVRRDTRVSICRCGHARQMPFCDNTCRSIGWREPSESAAAGAGRHPGGGESDPPSSTGG